MTAVRHTSRPDDAAEYTERMSWWICVCRCGREVVRNGPSLAASAKLGRVASCGCLIGKSRALPPGMASFNALLLKYRLMARHRGFVFNLGRDRFAELTSSPCHYCGALPAQQYGHRGRPAYTYNGIDRIDNGSGYVEGNVRPACGTCNRAKSTMSEADFYAWVERVHARVPA